MAKKSNAQAKWEKENLLFVRGQYKSEFVLNFKEACKKLNLTQSEVIRNAMIETIEKANQIKKPTSN